ncbi:hypothetical protein TcWFU_003706 [Taenia crassiceps]|uniref:Uncharacterized protein n=1 Tax=Taenia crassiceps TaxID=6207 RepID=A0ABR4Q1H3_9CEST
MFHTTAQLHRSTAAALRQCVTVPLRHCVTVPLHYPTTAFVAMRIEAQLVQVADAHHPLLTTTHTTLLKRCYESNELSLMAHCQDRIADVRVSVEHGLFTMLEVLVCPAATQPLHTAPSIAVTEETQNEAVTLPPCWCNLLPI